MNSTTFPADGPLAITPICDEQRSHGSDVPSERPSAENSTVESDSVQNRFMVAAQMSAIVAASPAAMYVRDAAGNIFLANARARELLGETLGANGASPDKLRWQIRGAGFNEKLSEAALLAELTTSSNSRRHEVTVDQSDGFRIHGQLTVAPVRLPTGAFAGSVHVLEDVTERSRDAMLVAGQNRALQAIVSGEPIATVLEHLVQTVEKGAAGDVVAGILLVDHASNCLRHGAAPSLPDDYNRAIDGVPVSPDIGTCARAAAINQVVITPDIDSDPGWASIKHLPLGLGLRAAWSMPIISSKGKVLGTFGTYFRQCRTPTQQERGIVAVLCKTAAIAIERRAVEEATRVSEQHLRAIFETSPECVKLVTPEGVLLDINQSGCAMLGAASPAELIGRNLYDVIHAADREAYRAMCARVDGGSKERLELRMVNDHAEQRWMETQVAPIHDVRSGRLVHLAVTREITSRKRAEEQQRALYDLVAAVNRAATLRDVFGLALDAVLRVHASSRAAILLRDDSGVMRFVASTGLSEAYQKAVEGHSPWAPGDPKPQPIAIADVASADLDEHLRAVIAREGIAALAFVPLVSDQRLVGKVMIYRDAPHAFSEAEFRQLEAITSQVAFAIERHRSSERLEHLVAERTASLQAAIDQMEEFSYSVSHDLRSPVRAMCNYADALIEDYGDRLDAQGREWLTRIQRGGSRMDRLIRDLLTYSRISRRELRLEAVCVERLVHEVIAQYPELRAHNTNIEIVGSLPTVTAHEPSLTQVISNLLTNAAKFVAPGQQPMIRVRSEQEANRARVWIEDNGIGIPPETQSRLFGMFERLHPENNYEGTGIGLAIVRKAIERMGGSVGVVSDGKTGSRFWFELTRATRA
jgi:PAS domain S-box-containing protein